MAKDGVPGEVTGVLDERSVKAGVWQQHGNSVSGGINGLNGSARMGSTVVNIGEDGKTTTDVMVSVVVARPEAPDPKKAPEATAGSPQRVAQSKGVINNTQVEAAPQPARLGAAPAAAVGGPAATARLGRAPGRGLVARPGGPVAQPRAGGQLAASPPSGPALTAKNNGGPRVEGPEAQPDPKAQPQRFVVEEKVLAVKGIAAHRLREDIVNLRGDNSGAGKGPQLREPQGPQHDDHGPQHGRRPSHRTAMPRVPLEDGGPAPEPDVPPPALERPAAKGQPAARVVPSTAKYAQGAIAPPSPLAKTT